jgi:flagellar FliJ protein
MNRPDALNTLLEQAEAERDGAQRALQRTIAEAESARGQHTQLLDYRSEYEQRYTAQFGRGGSIEVVRCYQGFSSRLTQAIEQQARVVQHLDTRIEPARRALQQAETQVASIRKLQQRRREEVLRALDRGEQRSNDEFATNRAARAGAAGPGSPMASSLASPLN